MKNGIFLTLVLVLGLIPIASATVIDVVTDGIGDKGHKGTIDDPLEVGENIDIKIVLNRNVFTYGGAPFPGYDGCLLSEMDVTLQVSGPGELGPKSYDKSGNVFLNWDPGFGNTAFSPTTKPEIENQNGFDYLRGQSTNGIPGYATLVEWLYIYVEGQGNIQLDLSLHGTTRYSPYKYESGPPYDPYPGGWIDATNSDLGDLTIYVIPEPTTIALMGLAGLALLKKRKP